MNEFVGPDIGLFDRVAGAALGAVRVGLIAVLIVAVFDRIIPADLEPPFLAGSRLRPYLSAVARKGLQSLPPEVDAYIDRLKVDARSLRMRPIVTNYTNPVPTSTF